MSHPTWPVAQRALPVDAALAHWTRFKRTAKFRFQRVTRDPSGRLAAAPVTVCDLRLGTSCSPPSTAAGPREIVLGAAHAFDDQPVPAQQRQRPSCRQRIETSWTQTLPQRQDFKAC